MPPRFCFLVNVLSRYPASKNLIIRCDSPIEVKNLQWRNRPKLHTWKTKPPIVIIRHSDNQLVHHHCTPQQDCHHHRTPQHKIIVLFSLEVGSVVVHHRQSAPSPHAARYDNTATRWTAAAIEPRFVPSLHLRRCFLSMQDATVQSGIVVSAIFG